MNMPGQFDSCLDHLALYVPDLQEAEAVMKELLGYERQSPMEVRPVSLRFWSEAAGGFQFVLCQISHHDDVDKLDSTYRWAAEFSPAVHHLAHRVPEVKEEYLALLGLKAVTSVASNGQIRQVFVEVAGDGVLHELVERLSSDSSFSESNVATLMRRASLEVGSHQRSVSRRK